MKRLAHGVHESRRGEGLTAVKAEERGDAAVSLQPGLVDVEVHAVDAFDFQSHVLLEDFGDGTWYDSWVAPVVTTPRGQPTASRFKLGMP